MIDIPGSVIKGAPDFCNVYVISRGKIQNMRTASRPAPASSPLRSLLLSQSGVGSHSAESQFPHIETMSSVFFLNCYYAFSPLPWFASNNPSDLN